MISSILIIENQYISPVYLFKKSGIVTGIKIEQYEEYQKNSFRNRCILMGPNGLLPLSVPLVNGRHQKGLVRDIRICYKENWPLRHWRSIHDAYRKSPFFEVYMDDIKSFFESKPIFLFDWNLAWLEWLFKKSGSQCTISLTTESLKEYPADYIDLRNQLTPKNYRDFGSGLPAYVQVFADRKPFEPNLSFLDMLLCEGPNAGRRLWR